MSIVSKESLASTFTPRVYLTLAEAAKIAPGRPSTNCLWRWCRRGIIARTGERVRLRHIRSGGKVLTSADWVRDFCEALAERDTAHFDAKLAAAAAMTPREPQYAPPSRRRQAQVSGSSVSDHLAERVARELDQEGI